MPDITLCCNKKCPMRNGCYRYLCKPSPQQSWAIFPTWPSCSRWSPHDVQWRVTGPTFDVDTFWHVPIGGGPGPGAWPGASSYTQPQECERDQWVVVDGGETCIADEVAQ